MRSTSQFIVIAALAVVFIGCTVMAGTAHAGGVSVYPQKFQKVEKRRSTTIKSTLIVYSETAARLVRRYFRNGKMVAKTDVVDVKLPKPTCPPGFETTWETDTAVACVHHDVFASRPPEPPPTISAGTVTQVTQCSLQMIAASWWTYDSCGNPHPPTYCPPGGDTSEMARRMPYKCTPPPDPPKPSTQEPIG